MSNNPTHIGRYEVVGKIGSGGMGVVYRGRDPQFDRQVAIKVLHAQYADNHDVALRFRSEAVIEAKLGHPHIVTVFDFVEQDGSFAFVMEFVDGRPLDECLRRCPENQRGPLARDLARQVCWALDHAHRNGLVHRDIKPGNILVQQFGERFHARVLDFGVAKVLGPEFKGLTAVDAKMGTLCYMSPEQVRSPKHVDHRADIYSLGMTLYEGLIGNVPFDTESEYELMRQIIERPVDAEALMQFGALGGTILRALSKEPGNRWQSAAEFERALSPDVVPQYSRPDSAGGEEIRTAPVPQHVLQSFGIYHPDLFKNSGSRMTVEIVVPSYSDRLVSPLERREFIMRFAIAGALTYLAVMLTMTILSKFRYPDHDLVQLFWVSGIWMFLGYPGWSHVVIRAMLYPLLGVAQAWAMRRQLTFGRAWLYCSCFAALVVMLLSFFPQSQGLYIYPPIVLVLGQWLVLRKYARAASWWLGSGAVAWLMIISLQVRISRGIWAPFPVLLFCLSLFGFVQGLSLSLLRAKVGRNK